MEESLVCLTMAFGRSQHHRDRQRNGPRKGPQVDIPQSPDPAELRARERVLVGRVELFDKEFHFNGLPHLAADPFQTHERAILPGAYLCIV